MAKESKHIKKDKKKKHKKKDKKKVVSDEDSELSDHLHQIAVTDQPKPQIKESIEQNN